MYAVTAHKNITKHMSHPYYDRDPTKQVLIIF